MDLRDRLSLEHPVLQAGMGQGIAGWELASTVSMAGGLGTVGFDSPRALDATIARTKALVQGRPYAVNLLMPLLRPDHVACVIRHKAPIVSMFYGFDRRAIRAVKESGACLIYQVGSEAEAELVVASGADVLIVQGFEAGGHVRGNEPLRVILPRIRARYPKMPILAAGGIHDRHSAARAISLGADGVSCGTRFLMTHESRAHDAYKARLVQGQETMVTTLFGLGWPAPHRVLINDAVRRWCDQGGKPAVGVRALNWLSQFGSRYAPPSVTKKLFMAQRVNRPIFTPMYAAAGMDHACPAAICDYAGECVREIGSIESVGVVLAELAAGC